MKNVVFLMTHHWSNWESVVDFLNQHPDVQCYNTDNSYWHPDDLYFLTSKPHKKNNAASVWVDVIFHNKDFACDALCKSCGFIYWAKSEDEITCPIEECRKYHRHRLFGLASYYKRTPKAVWNPKLQPNLFLGSVFGRENAVVAGELPAIP